MLYCVPNIKIQQYKNILKSFLQLKKQWIDIEHHIYDQENIYEMNLYEMNLYIYKIETEK